MQGQVFQHRYLRLVTEAYLVEYHLASDPPGCRVFLLPGHFGLQIQHFKHTLRPGNRRLEQIVLVGELVERLAELVGIIKEADNNTDCNHLMISKNTARHRDNKEGQVAHRVHHRAHGAGEGLRLHSDGPQPFIDLPELADCLFLPAEYLDDLQSGDIFLHEAVYLA
ncbi:hypothetical protein D3C80_1599760 [compost metagenome]